MKSHTYAHFCQSFTRWRLTYKTITPGNINLPLPWTISQEKTGHQTEFNGGSTGKMGENRLVNTSLKPSENLSMKAPAGQRHLFLTYQNDMTVEQFCFPQPRAPATGIFGVPKAGAKPIISGGIQFFRRQYSFFILLNYYILLHSLEIKRIILYIRYESHNTVKWEFM
ncbi:hypothetical protein L0665_06095 [Methanogenium marinum]|uniref:Uncharacterized protein n=1 Tax=Methanogenium marinum TaxID=348610 RepID=A0A9Q4KT31_9EURY|nr:hypothetical protein [Methanogenium marinum]MDE4908179.1 hypothetical protein [Methanogenium marinum]